MSVDVAGAARRDAWRVAVVAVPAGFLLAMYVVPLGAVLWRVLRGDPAGVDGGPGVHGLAGLIGITIGQAVASTLLALVVGLPCAWCHARLRIPGGRWWWSAVLVPFVLPTVVIAAGVIAVAGRPGAPLGDHRGSWWLVVAVHAAVNLAVVVRTVGVAISRVDPAIEEAARMSGRGRFRAATLSLRAARPAVLGAAFVVFVFCLTSFGLVLLLGPSTSGIVETEIWTRTTTWLDLRGAGALALGQLAVVVAALVLHQRMVARRLGAGPAARVVRRRAVGVERWWVAAVLTAEAVAVLLPLGGLFARSLRTSTGWGLDNFAALLRSTPGSALAVTPLRAVVGSVLVGLAAAAISMLVGVCGSIVASGRGALARASDLALMLPLGTSAATVGFGVLVASAVLPVDLRGSWWAIPLVEAAVATPLVVRALAPAIDEIDQRLPDAARVLGVGAWATTLRVRWPLLRPAIVGAVALAFAVSLGEFGATAFLSREDAPTVPVVIVRLLGRPGSANLGQAMALGVVLAVLAAASVAALDRALGSRSGEF